MFKLSSNAISAHTNQHQVCKSESERREIINFKGHHLLSGLNPERVQPANWIIIIIATADVINNAAHSTTRSFAIQQIQRRSSWESERASAQANWIAQMPAAGMQPARHARPPGRLHTRRCSQAHSVPPAWNYCPRLTTVFAQTCNLDAWPKVRMCALSFRCRSFGSINHRLLFFFLVPSALCNAGD